MDIANYTRGYQYGMSHAEQVCSEQHGHVEIQDFDEEAERMHQNGDNEDYIDGFLDGCEQKMDDITNGIQSSIEMIKSTVETQ